MSTTKRDDNNIEEIEPGNNIAFEGSDEPEVQKRKIKPGMKNIIQQEEPKKIFRILAEDEKKVLSIEAYGFLINMMSMGSIDTILFEKVIHISLQIYGFTRKKISRDMITDILNMIVFSGKEDLSLRDFLEVFGNPDADYEIKEEIN